MYEYTIDKTKVFSAKAYQSNIINCGTWSLSFPKTQQTAPTATISTDATSPVSCCNYEKAVEKKNEANHKSAESDQILQPDSAEAGNEIVPNNINSNKKFFCKTSNRFNSSCRVLEYCRPAMALDGATLQMIADNNQMVTVKQGDNPARSRRSCSL
ncbi:uncharacterized protein LOC129905939 [Episyrphus balteatus]|uniref:uncharacterized protein LOC129905939 n=1 Tax=Episyrphus balteatus TaxID=286459 RepID=UPI002485FBA2|nr:uncharacterized protein LOC129905939 [Episyrphus balteatus]